MFKENSSVFTLITYNAIHQIISSGCLGTEFQFFFLFF